MPILIDGHNLIGGMPDLSLKDPEDESILVQRVRRYCWRHRQRATIVFDAGCPGGRSRTLSNPQVEVIFAHPGQSADALLVARIRRARDPAGLIVVSDDRAVQAAARARKARVLSTRAFAARLDAVCTPRRERTEKPEGIEDVEEWLRLFGIEE